MRSKFEKKSNKTILSWPAAGRRRPKNDVTLIKLLRRYYKEGEA